jgi:hypothetical protein
MDETTTEATVDTGVTTIQGVQVDDQGTAVAQPEQTEEVAEAVDTTTETEQAPEVKETSSEPSEEEQLAKFAKTKGLELDSANAKKAAKMAMEAEKRMHQATGRATQLEKTMTTMSDESAEQVANVTGQDPEVLKRVQRMEVKDAIRDFWESNPGAREYQSEMATIATESGLYGSPESILKASYALAMANNQNAVRSQGKREALESLAHKQQAAVPRGSAVNSQSSPQAITPQNVDQLVAQNNQAWFEKNYAAINRAMEG